MRYDHSKKAIVCMDCHKILAKIPYNTALTCHIDWNYCSKCLPSHLKFGNMNLNERKEDDRD